LTMPRPSHADTLERVRLILEATCDRDGQGHNLQETQRRKNYRAGINEALVELTRSTAKARKASDTQESG
jgi:hypothetical protein